MAVENIEQIEQSFGLEKGKLAEMMASEETHRIDIDNFVIKPKSDYEDLLKNMKNQYLRDGSDIGRKEMFKSLGMEIEGTGVHKDPLRSAEYLLEWQKNSVLDAMNEAKIEPNKKYDSLKTDFEKLQGNLTEWQSKYNNLESTYKQREQEATINNTLLKEIPDNTILPKEDVLAILKARYQFNIGEDGFEIIKDGKVEKNQANMNLLSPSEFMKEFITPYLKPIDGGAGGVDSTGGNKETSLELFDKQMEAKGINIGSESYNEQMSIAIKNGTLKL